GRSPFACASSRHSSPCFIFFFQAEDGIRARNVTGVQTCALPILGQAKVNNPDPSDENLFELPIKLPKLNQAQVLNLLIKLPVSLLLSSGNQSQSQSLA